MVDNLREWSALGLPLRRSMFGYSRRATNALLAAMEEEQAANRAEWADRSAGLSQELADVRSLVHQREREVQGEQERQRVLMALLEEISARGAQALLAAQARMAQSEAEILEEIARRELVLGHRRSVLRSLREDTSRAVRRALDTIEREPPGADEAAATHEAAPPDAGSRAVVNVQQDTGS